MQKLIPLTLITLTMLLLALSSLAYAQTGEAEPEPVQPYNIEWVGQAGGEYIGSAIFVDNQRVYLNINDRLSILDVSTPNTPLLLGQSPVLSRYRDIAVKDEQAYVMIPEQGIQLIDVSDPTKPTPTSFYPNMIAHDITVADDYLYLAKGEAGFQIFDISRPLSPTLVGSYDGGLTTKVNINGKYAYTGEGEIIDMSNLANPILISRYESTDGNSWKTVSDGYAYGLKNLEGFLDVIDISNPSRPTLISQHPAATNGIAYYAFDVVVQNGYAYLLYENGYIEVVQLISDSAHNYLDRVNGYPTHDRTPYALTVEDDYLYIIEKGGLEILDISDPTDPTHAGYYNIANEAFDVGTYNGYLYTLGEVGVGIFDISQPAKPTFVDRYNNHSFRGSGVFQEGYFYVTDMYWYSVAPPSKHLKIFDIRQPLKPTLADLFGYDYSYIYNESIGPVSVSEHYAYLKMGHRTLTIDTAQPPSCCEYTHIPIEGELLMIDISDPTNVKQVNQYWPMIPVSQVADRGEHAYIADGDDLRIMEISNPVRPEVVADYETPGTATGIAIREAYAYVADGSSLQILDLTVPLSLTVVGSYPISSSVSHITLSDDYAYLIGSDLYVVDVSDPASPTLMGRYPISSWAEVAVSDDYIYVAKGKEGATILRLGQDKPER